MAFMDNLSTFQQVEALYVNYFGRAGDPTEPAGESNGQLTGTDYWVDRIESGEMSIKDVAASFSVQPESAEHHPLFLDLNTPNANPSAFIDMVYDHCFGRAPDAEGKAYWMEQLAGRDPSTVGSFVLDVINGAQGPDIEILSNKVAAASYWTAKVDDSDCIITHDAGGYMALNTDAFHSAQDAVMKVTHDDSSVDHSAEHTNEFVAECMDDHAHVGLVGVIDDHIDVHG
jgi:hypothetical protein